MAVVRRLALFSILLLLPFGSLLWVIDQAQLAARKQQRDDVIEGQKRIVANFARQSSIGFFFREASERLIRTLKYGEDPVELIHDLPENTTTLFLFSQRGKRRSSPGFATDLIAASERCLALILQTAREGGATLSPRDRKLAASLLGNENAITIIAQRLGHLVSLESLGEEKSAGCFPYRTDQGGSGYVLMLVNHRKNLAPVLIARAQKRLEDLVGKDQTFGCTDLTTETASPSSTPLPASISSYHDRSFGSTISDDGARIWAWRVLHRRFLLSCQASLPPPLTSFGKRNPFLIVALLLGLIFTLIARQRLDQRGVSIRIQIVFLFGLSSLGSIAALTGFAGLFVEHRKETLLREHSNQASEILNQWDTTFQQFCQRRDLEYRRCFDEMADHLHSPEQLARIANRIPGLGTKVTLMIVDPDGVEIFRKNSTANMTLPDFLGENYAQILRKALHNNIQIFTVRKKHQTLRPDLEPKMESAMFESLTRQFREKRGETRNFSIGAKTQMLFSDFIFDRQGFPQAAVFLSPQNRFLEHAYLTEMQSHPPPWCQAPFPIKVFSVSDTGAVHSLISRKLGSNLIQELNDSITQTQEPQHRFVSLSGELGGFLLTGIPCRHLSNIRLFLVSSLAQIEQRSHSLIQTFLAFGVFITLFGFSLSLVFSHLLLHPMNRIAEGLNHLAAGTFSHRIDIRTGDEMQELSSGLNKTLEEMQELALARSIQEHLFPPGPLKTDHCECHGWTRSQAEIGGEIFDFQTLPNDLIGFWLAGVPGHSIGSALVLAMMKMAGRLFLSFGEKSPSKIHEQLYQFIQTKLATDGREYLCIGVFDPREKVVHICVNGSFLVARICSRHGESPEIAFPDNSSPEGDSPRNLTFSLPPGGKLFLGSPGFLAHTSRRHLEEFLTPLLQRNSEQPTPALGQLILASVTDVDVESGSQTRSVLALEVK